MSLFSQRLLELRTQKKLSQNAAAKILKLGNRTYQYYESGEREPTLSTLVRIADFYDVSLDYLAGRTDAPQGAFPESAQQMQNRPAGKLGE